MVTSPRPAAMSLREAVVAHRVMAIVRGDDADAAAATVRVLIEEGIHLVEVTLTTPGALDVIAHAAAAAPPEVFVGAGTVLTAGDVSDVIDAGARFAVTPCLSDSLDAAVAAGLPVAAGAFTPSELYEAHRRGADLVKLFPASALGPDYVKAVRDPLPDLPILVVGGVGAEQLPAYLAAGALGGGIGGPLIGDAARGGDLDALRSRIRRFTSVAAS